MTELDIPAALRELEDPAVEGLTAVERVEAAVRVALVPVVGGLFWLDDHTSDGDYSGVWLDGGTGADRRIYIDPALESLLRAVLPHRTPADAGPNVEG